MLSELDQANKCIEALNICIKQDDEQLADQQRTIDALVAALEHIQRHAKDRSEKAWFRLDVIADEADAALALARGEG